MRRAMKKRFICIPCYGNGDRMLPGWKIFRSIAHRWDPASQALCCLGAHDGNDAVQTT